MAPTELERIIVHPEVELDDLVDAMIALMKREEQVSHHQISREALSVRERMSSVLLMLQEYQVLSLNSYLLWMKEEWGLLFPY